MKFVEAFKSSGAKVVSKFLQGCTDPNYKGILENTTLTWIRAYDNGKLKDVPNGSKCLRIRNRKFEDVENRLVRYFHFRRERVHFDKCGLSWNLLIEKAKQFAAQAKIEDPENNDKFVGSSGWLSGVLQRHNLGSLNLHGEGGEVTAEEAEEKMKEFRTNLSDTMEKHDIATIATSDTTATALASSIQSVSSISTGSTVCFNSRPIPC